MQKKGNREMAVICAVLNNTLNVQSSVNITFPEGARRPCQRVFRTESTTEYSRLDQARQMKGSVLQ